MAERLTSSLGKAKKEVPPDLMTVLLIDIGETLVDVSELQTKILKHMKETTAEGVDIPLPEKTVTRVSTVNLIKDYPYRPLRKVDFFNKGPDTVYIRVNEEAKEIPIENRESYVAERPRATIEYITLRVAAGQTSTTKMVGSY